MLSALSEMFRRRPRAFTGGAAYILLSLTLITVFVTLWRVEAGRHSTADRRAASLEAELGTTRSMFSKTSDRLDQTHAEFVGLRTNFRSRVTRLTALQVRRAKELWMERGKEHGYAAGWNAVFRANRLTTGHWYAVRIQSGSGRSSLSSVTGLTEGSRYAVASASVTKLAEPPPPPPPPPAQSASCNTNYSGCLLPDASDYDCEGGSGDGPYYTGPVTILGYDEYGLDADGDGYGCE